MVDVQRETEDWGWKIGVVVRWLHWMVKAGTSKMKNHKVKRGILCQRSTSCYRIRLQRARKIHRQSVFDSPLFLQLLQQNQINQINAMQEPARPTTQQHDDIIIDSQNCCTPLIRKTNSSQSIQCTANSQKSISLNKEKGIQLTSKTKSFTRLPTHIKRVTRRTDSLTLEENANRKRQEDKQMINAESALNISLRKTANSLRCIEYKNKKVKEHMHDQVERASNCLRGSMKEEELYSTRKDTARTLKNSEDLCFEKSHSFFRNLAVEHSGFHQQKTHTFYEPKASKGGQSPQKKTLQRVYEQKQGRRIVTLESQISNKSEQSETESFVLKQNN